jgi:hypothetical protein
VIARARAEVLPCAAVSREATAARAIDRQRSDPRKIDLVAQHLKGLACCIPPCHWILNKARAFFARCCHRHRRERGTTPIGADRGDADTGASDVYTESHLAHIATLKVDQVGSLLRPDNRLREARLTTRLTCRRLRPCHSGQHRKFATYPTPCSTR